MTLISARGSAHDFIVKFSPSVCVAVVASLTGEMAARSLLTMLMEQQTVTNPAVFCGLCAMINHLTSIIYSTVTCICYESKLTILVGLPDLCNLLVGTGAQDFNEALYICSCFTDSTVQSFGIIESL